MVTKKRVVVTLLIVSLVIASVSAAGMARGGFGYQAATEEDSEVRPVQRWQTLSEEDLANCPMLASGEIDPEALRLFQETRLEARQEREDVQGQYGRGNRQNVQDNGRYAQSAKRGGGPQRSR
jgi:hypothetical protein